MSSNIYLWELNLTDDELEKSKVIIENSKHRSNEKGELKNYY